MPKSKVNSREAKGISDRLKTFARRYGSWAEFARKLKVPRTTAVSWARLKNPSVPEVPFLLRLAREANVNLHWLLLGEGSELRERPADSPAERVKAAIEAELRQSEDATPEEFQAAWDRMMIRGDWSAMDDVVLRLAVEGVRPRFQENLRLVRHYAGLAHVYNYLRKVLEELERKDADQAQKVRQRVEELLALPLESLLSGDSPIGNRSADLVPGFRARAPQLRGDSL